MNPHRIGILKFALKIALSVGLLLLLIYKIDGPALRKSLFNTDITSFLFAVAVFLFITMVQAWRWLHIARRMGVFLGLRDAAIVTFIGTFFNQVLPSAVGGDAVRVYKLYRSGLPVGIAFNSVAIDRIAGVLALVLIAVLGVFLLDRALFSVPLGMALVLIALAGLVGLGLLLSLDKLPLPRGLKSNKTVVKLVLIAADARKIYCSARTIIPVMIVSILIHASVSCVFWLLGRHSGLGVSFATCFVLVPLALLFTIAPISVGGWGVREGAIVVVFGVGAGNPSAALATSILLGFAMAFAALPGAVFWFMRSRFAVGEQGA